jgi:hypothetical protein
MQLHGFTISEGRLSYQSIERHNLLTQEKVALKTNQISNVIQIEAEVSAEIMIPLPFLGAN